MTRHPTDAVSLWAGVVFAALGGVALLDRAGAVDADVRWLPAVVLIVVGVAVLAGGLARGRAREGAD